VNVGNLWLKIKVWTKVLIVLALFVYSVVFVIKNSARPVKPWFWINREPETSVLILVLCAFLLGVIGTILFRTTLKTIRQIRQLKDRTRTERLEREMAEMRTKAGMLRARAAPDSAEGPAPETELP
jgi:uncharacterized membrane protein YciS (DUF1049 family)